MPRHRGQSFSMPFHLEDMQARPLGTVTLQPGDDVKGAARKILREKQHDRGAFPNCDPKKGGCR